jgi:MinD-like ATPase involved in chromosome partitioning or flagellar assembly
VPDQAEGLRRLFVADARRMVAIVPAGENAAAAAAVADLARTLAAQGKRVLVLDELLAAGNSHPVFDVTPRHDLATVMLSQVEVESALVKASARIDLLAGGNHASTVPRPRMEARIGLVNAFYRLAGKYDVVLVNACIDGGNSRPSFAWACQDVIVLSAGLTESATEVYACIKLLHQSEKRRFHLLFCGVEQASASALYRSIAAVSRRHLHVMPEFLGVLPQANATQDGFYAQLAGMIQSWPMPEHKAGHFPDLMRRLLGGANPQVLQTLLK